MADPSQHPELGACFGRYRIVQHLATGGMAEIFLARVVDQPDHAPPVVLKRLHRRLHADELFIRMFLDEARIAARLDHPGIARVFDLGHERGDFWLAMEYVPGIDLDLLYEAALRTGAPIPPAIAARICAELCEALEYAHARTDRDGRPLGIVHRDVTPSNVIVAEDGRIKLCDFGIARAATLPERTEAGTLTGKFRYMAPEQVRGRAVDLRADLFSVGVVLYELTLGENPFQRPEDTAILRAVLHEAAPRPTELRRGFPPLLERVILRAIEKDPERRHATAGELRAELERYLAASGAPIGTREVGAYARAVGALQDPVPQDVVAPGPELPPEEPLTLTKRRRNAGERLLRPQPPFLGREDEMVRLLATAQVARRGIRTVLLVGGPGAGRSRVLAELGARLVSRGHRVLRATGRPAGGALEVVDQLVRALAGVGDAPPGEAAARLLAEGSRLLGEERGESAAALVGQLVGMPFDDHPAVRLFRGHEGSARSRATAALKELLAAAAAAAPLALLIDDAHRAEGANLEALEALCAGLDVPPLLLVVSATTRLRAVRPGTLPGADVLELPPLPDAAMEKIAIAVGALTRAVPAVVAHAAGNPLAALELVRLIEDGVAAEGLPDGLEAAIRERAARFSADERDALARAAVLGDPVRRGDVVEVGSERAAESLERLVELGVLDPVAPGEYRFTRAAWRDVADRALPKAERQALHRLAAERLLARGKSGDLQAAAQHLERAGDPNRAAAALLASGDRARERFALREAAELYAQALRVADAPRARFAIAQRLEAAYNSVGDRARGRQVIEQLALLAAHLGKAEQAHAELARLRLDGRVGDLAAVLENAGQVIAAAAAAGDAAGEGTAWVTYARALMRASRIEEATGATARAIRIARRAADQGPLSHALSHAGTLRVMQGDYPRAVRLFLRALDLANHAGEARQGTTCLQNLAEAWLALGHIDRALPLREKALELCREVGYRWGEGHALASLANTYRIAGRPAEGIAAAREGIAVLDAVEERYQGAAARAYLALCHLARGEEEDLALAEAAAWDAVQLARQSENPTAEVEGLTAAAIAALGRGEVERAAASSRRAHELLIARGPLLEFETEALYTHHVVMRHAGDAPAAQEALAGAWARVEAAASRIRHPEARDHFLARVPINAAIVAARERLAAAAG